MNTLKFNQIQFNHIGEQPSMPLQEKSVTITENGTTEVVPDSGYALGKVEVKVNTPKRDIRHYNATNIVLENPALISVINVLGIVCAYAYVHSLSNKVVYYTGSEISKYIESLKGFVIDYDMYVTVDDTTYSDPPEKIGEILKSDTNFSVLIDMLQSAEITEEEYYNLYNAE